MVEQNKKYDTEAKGSSHFFTDASNEAKIGFIGIALGAPVQYKKDHVTGLEQMCLMIPNEKDNGFTPCVFTFGINDCIGNSAFNAICKNIGVHDFIFSNGSLDQIIDKLAEHFNRKFNLKKGNEYSEGFLKNKLYEFRLKLETFSPGADLYDKYLDAEKKLLDKVNKMYSVDNKSKNQTTSQQAK